MTDTHGGVPAVTEHALSCLMSNANVVFCFGTALDEGIFAATFALWEGTYARDGEGWTGPHRLPTAPASIGHDLLVPDPDGRLWCAESVMCSCKCLAILYLLMTLPTATPGTAA